MTPYYKLNDFHRADYVSKSSQANKHFVENERTKYGENSNTCVIACSGNYNSVGRVTNVNSDLYRILGYYQRDIGKAKTNWRDEIR